MNIRFPCPVCETPGRLPGLPGAEWRCPACDHTVRLADGAVDPTLPCCAVCGNAELYRKKDFPHALGMGILVAACLASTVTYGLYDKVLMDRTEAIRLYEEVLQHETEPAWEQEAKKRLQELRGTRP